MQNGIKVSMILLSLVFAIGAGAQKYGYVNTEELVLSLPEVKEANTVIEKMRDSLGLILDGKISDLEKKYRDLESRIDDISPNQQKKELQALKAEENEIGKFEQSLNNKLLLKSQELMTPIQEKINKALQEVASEGNYLYIFDGSIGNILYADESTDISGLIKAKL